VIVAIEKPAIAGLNYSYEYYITMGIRLSD